MCQALGICALRRVLANDLCLSCCVRHSQVPMTNLWLASSIEPVSFDWESASSAI